MQTGEIGTTATFVPTIGESAATLINAMSKSSQTGSYCGCNVYESVKKTVPPDVLSVVPPRRLIRTAGVPNSRQ